ncbi:MAG: hypothetical protein RBU45_01840 [Myxococcota bacterium]|jgi:hypothetical protein|nr:hypothetical protein [Myxococcota bacterium]
MKQPHVLPQFARRVRSALPLVLVALLAQGLAGQSCGTKEQQQKLASPVQALGNLYEHPGGVVEAELVLVSTKEKEHVFLDSAREVQVRLEYGEAIPLTKDASRAGRWAVTSTENPALTFSAGKRYAFSFRLEDEPLAGDQGSSYFQGEVVAIDDPVIPVATSNAAQGFSLDLDVGQAFTGSRRGVLRVFGPTGALVHDNFDLTHPRFDGSKHAELIQQPKITVPASAFQTAGNYRVVLYTMNYAAGFDEHLSAELGWLSGFMAGSAGELLVEVK